MTEGYCVKCKKKQNMNNETDAVLERKTKAGKVIKMAAKTGVCPECSTKMFRIVGKKE